MQIEDIPDPNGQRLLRLLQKIHVALPEGVAALAAERTRDRSGTIVLLSPTNKNAACFSAHTDDGLNLIDVSFGEYSTYELPWEAGLPKNAGFDLMLTTAQDMCLAVIGGRCEHRFGFFGIRGTIRVDEQRIYRVTHLFHLRVNRKVVRYEPYYPSLLA